MNKFLWAIVRIRCNVGMYTDTPSEQKKQNIKFVPVLTGCMQLRIEKC